MTAKDTVSTSVHTAIAAKQIQYTLAKEIIRKLGRIRSPIIKTSQLWSPV
jgi:hypothetical protein